MHKNHYTTHPAALEAVVSVFVLPEFTRDADRVRRTAVGDCNRLVSVFPAKRCESPKCFPSLPSLREGPSTSPNSGVFFFGP